MTELENTFAGWAGAGRTVRRGERARFYLVDPEDPEAAGIALFQLDQTDDRDDLSTAGRERISAEEYKQRRADARNTGPKKPVAKLSWNPTTRTMKIWVGSNKAAIKRLKEKGWLFDLGSHRWRKTLKEPWPVARRLQEMGMHVETDGFSLGTIDEPIEDV